LRPVFILLTRREYIHVGSASASLLTRVSNINTDLKPSSQCHIQKNLLGVAAKSWQPFTINQGPLMVWLFSD